MPTRCTPGVFGTCAMYIAANLPAPIRPMRSGLSFALLKLGVEIHAAFSSSFGVPFFQGSGTS